MFDLTSQNVHLISYLRIRSSREWIALFCSCSFSFSAGVLKESARAPVRDQTSSFTASMYIHTDTYTTTIFDRVWQLFTTELEMDFVLSAHFVVFLPHLNEHQNPKKHTQVE